MKKLIDNFGKSMLGISMAIVFILTFLQVVYRFILKLPLPWAQDIIRMAFVYSVFFGAAICIDQHKHINVDILIDTIPGKKGIVSKIVLNFVVLIFVLMLAYYGMQFMQAGKLQFASYLRIPMNWFYLSLPLSMACSAYYLIIKIVDGIKVLQKEGK